MRAWEVNSIRLGRVVLFLLVFIHLVLPFTSINRHPELQILVGSLVLGILFLALAIQSFSKPYPFLAYGLALLLFVYVLSAATGASPPEEGFVVKTVFAVLLAAGAISAYKIAIHSDA